MALADWIEVTINGSNTLKVAINPSHISRLLPNTKETTRIVLSDKTELVAGESYVEVLRRLSMCGIGIETGG